MRKGNHERRKETRPPTDSPLVSPRHEDRFISVGESQSQRLAKNEHGKTGKLTLPTKDLGKIGPTIRNTRHDTKRGNSIRR